MKSLVHRLAIIVYDLRKELVYRAGFNKNNLTAGPQSGLVVCMTSYPARIKYSWLALESLFRQSDTYFHLTLVLAASQFPDKKIPRILRKMQKRGLEVIWVEKDRGSFDHLWPAYVKYPSCSVISVDDDKFFDQDMVAELRSSSIRNPGSIIGWRGWRMRLDNDTLDFGKSWTRADPDTASAALFIPPGNGSLFPPESLPRITGNDQLRMELCPNADDVWYWAMASLAGTESVCLGRENHRAVWKQSRTPALAQKDPGPLEFDATVEHFGIREELVRLLKAASAQQP